MLVSCLHIIYSCAWQGLRETERLPFSTAVEVFALFLDLLVKERRRFNVNANLHVEVQPSQHSGRLFMFTKRPRRWVLIVGNGKKYIVKLLFSLGSGVT